MYSPYDWVFHCTFRNSLSESLSRLILKSTSALGGRGRGHFTLTLESRYTFTYHFLGRCCFNLSCDYVTRSQDLSMWTQRGWSSQVLSYKWWCLHKIRTEALEGLIHEIHVPCSVKSAFRMSPRSSPHILTTPLPACRTRTPPKDISLPVPHLFFFLQHPSRFYSLPWFAS